MKIDIIPGDAEVIDVPWHRDQSNRYIAATYKTIRPGDQVALKDVPHGAAIEVNNQLAMAGNTNTKNRHVIDTQDERVHLMPNATVVTYLGKTKRASMKQGTAVRVMPPSKFAGEIYLVAKTGSEKIQLVQPGKERVIIERQYLVPVQVKLVEIP